MINKGTGEKKKSMESGRRWGKGQRRGMAYSIFLSWKRLLGCVVCVCVFVCCTKHLELCAQSISALLLAKGPLHFHFTSVCKVRG